MVSAFEYACMVYPMSNSPILSYQNWSIRKDLREKNVTYYNEYAKFQDVHTVKVQLTIHLESIFRSICLGDGTKFRMLSEL